MSSREILEKLQNDARRLRIGQRLPTGDGELPWELIKRVQDDFCFLLSQPDVTMEQVAEAMGPGYSRGTLSRFKNMTSRQNSVGDLDRVTRGINQFMETIARRRQSAMPHGFVETDVARRILVVIAKTIDICSIGVITGDAGRGKSLTLQAAAAIHPGSILIRVLHSTRGPAGFIKHLADVLHLREARSSHRGQLRVIEKLRGSGRALLIDEAHQLKAETLELLRDIHDECGVPIILIGTMKISEAVSDGDLFFGQLTSRVSLRYDITEDLRGVGGDDPRPLHTVDEIRKLYESDKVRFTDEGRLLLTRIANLPGLGGLRLVTKIVQIAAPIAGGEPIDAKLILQIIRTSHGRTYAIGRVERAIEQSQLAVA